MGKFENTGADKLYLTVVTLCIAMVSSGVLNYTTTPDRWTQPCGLPLNMTSHQPYDEQVSRKYILATFISLEETILQSAPLINKLVIQRLENPEHLMDSLRNETHDGLPQDVNTQTSTYLPTMTSSFIDDFLMLSVFAAFIETSKWDEQEFQNGEFVTMYQSLEKRHYSAMCQIQMLIASLNGTIEAFIKREDVIPGDFHQEGALARSIRDFVTLKEAELFYYKLIEKYDSLIS